MKKNALPPSSLSMLIRRIIAFFIDLGISSLLGIFVITDLVSTYVDHIRSHTEDTNQMLTDPSGALLFILAIYSAISLIFIAMPLRFFFKGHSVGSVFMKFHIENTLTQKPAALWRCLLRSPGTLLLGASSLVFYSSGVVALNLYGINLDTTGIFLVYYFKSGILVAVSLGLLVLEWLWVFISKELRSPGERFTKTRVVPDIEK